MVSKRVDSSMLPKITPDVRTSLAWPTEMDWRQYRPVITRLYMTENKTLEAVMIIMLAEYGFKATSRMFKSHLGRWGARKYKKRNDGRLVDHSVPCNTTEISPISNEDFEMLSYWSDSQRGDTDETETNTQQEFDILEQHIHDENHKTEASRDHLLEDTLAVSRILDSVTSVEDLCFTIRTYILGSFEAGAWIIKGGDLYPRNANYGCDIQCFGGKSHAADLYTLVRHSRKLFDQGEHENGGICLRLGFSRMQVILTMEDPFTVWELMNAVSYLYEAGWLEVLRSFLNQLVELSAATHSRFHPVCRIFDRLRGLLSNEVLHIMTKMRQCAVEEVEKVTGLSSLSALKLKLGWLRSLSLIQSGETVEELFRILLERSKAQFGISGIQSLLVLNRIGGSLHERKLYAEAEATGRELVSCASDQNLPDAAIAFKGRGLALVSRAQLAQEKYYDAGRSLDDLLVFNVAHYGWTDPLTIDTMVALEMCMEACGAEPEAKTIRAQRSRLVRQIKDL